MKSISLLLVASIVSISQLVAQATPVVHARQVHEQQRIRQGERSGELTRGEAARLEAQQAKIQRDKRAAKADGVVTPAERAKLHREQNRASRNIYEKKHNEVERH